MCRLFGFRSVFQSQVHSSLIEVENALTSQSVKHPDGWGVGYYRENIPHLIKSTERALDDHIFKKVSGVVTSQTVIAHIRKATQGDLTILNSHPFQYGKWIFAHNGNLKNFDQHKNKLQSFVHPAFKPFVLGTTDSELIFFIFLSYIEEEKENSSVENLGFDTLKAVLEKATRKICSVVGPLYGKDDACPKENHITFILTDGELMFSFNGGQNLFYSTYKKRCPERDHCPFLNNSCESETAPEQKINHLIFTSEELQNDNIWKVLPKGSFIGVDSNMTFKMGSLNIPFEK